MAYGIRICSGAQKGELYPLLDSREITIGRSPTNNIFVRDMNVSRVHSQVVVSGDVCTLTDLQSTNGTFVNGVSVGECQVKLGDEILVGSTRLQVEELAQDGHVITETAILEQ